MKNSAKWQFSLSKLVVWRKKNDAHFFFRSSMSPIEDDDLGVGEPPSVPQNVEVTDIQATSATLKWKEPKKDGGAPIKEYIIEFKGANDEEWQEGPKVKPKKFLVETVDGLTTNTKYQFRVSKKFASNSLKFAHNNLLNLLKIL